MSIFGRKKDDAPDAPATAEGAPAAPPREAEPAPGALRAPAANGAPMGMPPKPVAPPPGARPAGAAPPPGAVPGATTPRAQPMTSERRTLVVGRGISLQGTVSDAERLVVEGTVESQMIQAAELMISPTGVFRGEVEVEDAEIAGLFDGTITARGALTLRASGKVKGTIRYRRLSVEDGGGMMGTLEMLPDQG